MWLHACAGFSQTKYLHPQPISQAVLGCVPVVLHLCMFLCLMSLLAIATSTSTCTPSDESISPHSAADSGNRVSFLSLRLGPGLSQHLQSQAGTEAAAAALKECLLQQKGFASDGAADDNFDFSVGISGDTAIVGDPHHHRRGLFVHTQRDSMDPGTATICQRWSCI
ncbi:unnamed protein product [Polarella glacialis]|uniref:Uncharacterized protein n=1 Tax=Polarella glacialis TaxID=89957 RepID=A0A813HGD6_POLGL|nr:unnamed protein product [Polarella glacialis]